MNLIQGFTPVPDAIRDDIDILAAIVFGRVWRYCQENGVCYASLDTLAQRCGIGATATRERLRQLEERGWLTREQRNGTTARYRDTGKWSIKVVGGATTEADTPTADVGGATADVGVPQREALGKIQEQDTSSKDTHADAWAPLYDAVQDSLGGARVLAKRTGRPLAWVGQLCGIAGRHADDDPGRAVRLWREYARSDEWRYRPRDPTKLPASFGAWCKQRLEASNGTPGRIWAK